MNKRRIQRPFPTCGIEDIFFNDDSRYECRKCGRVMDIDYAARVRAFSPKWFKKIQDITPR